MGSDCPWCAFNPLCDKADSCDFRSLKYEKEAILERVKSELVEVDRLKKGVLKSDDDERLIMLRSAMDRLAGVNIMSARLKVDFGMTDEGLRVACEMKEMNFMQKMKLAILLKKMQMSR